MKHLLAAFALLWASVAAAETLTLSLGGDPIGTMSFDGQSLNANVTSSPLGVANGRFSASSKRVQMADGAVVRQYLSDAPRKGRQISVLHEGGTVLGVTVSPSSDATALSDPGAVPAGVSDPVLTMGRILNATAGCPATQRFFDGRRAITLSPQGQSSQDGTLTCEIAYRVTGGPGHLSPLFISRAKLAVRYDVSGAQRFRDLTISSGPFALTVSR